MATERIAIEVAAALPDRQVLVSLEVPVGTTVLGAAERARLDERLPGLEIDPQRLGVFGKRRGADAVVEEGDRVEVYRPLRADPKEVRRQLAELARSRRGQD